MALASFTTLPLELKARVVEMASDQEDVRRERPKVYARAEHINSLGSFALVNKELRELAAWHQFAVVRSTTKIHRPIFRFAILPHHGHRITEVVLEHTSSAEGEPAALLLSDLAHLTAVRSLSFDRHIAIVLFGPGVTLEPDPDETRFYRVKALTDISPNIETLALREQFKPSETIGLLRTFKTLRTLILTDLRSEPAEQTAALTATISSLRNLRALTVSLSIESDREWPIEALAPLERDPPPIARLQLLGFSYTRRLLELIRPFSPTLEKLSLIPSSEPSDLALLPPPTPLQLPRLVNLYLQLIDMTTLGTLNSLLLSVSTLQQLTFTSYDDDTPIDPEDPSLPSLLSSQPNLRRLRFEEHHPQQNKYHVLPPTSSYLAAFADLVHSRGLDLANLDRPHLTPFHPDADLVYDHKDSEAKYLKEVLGRTLDFGKSELERMLAEGNIDKAARWVAKLMELEEERLSWKD
ncbi:hypothetical protein RQP46_003146 [Phenoliferia psychrophenolica]